MLCIRILSFLEKTLASRQLTNLRSKRNIENSRRLGLHHFASESAASYTWSMVSSADADAFYFFKVGAVHAKPFNVFFSGLELLARNRGTMMKRTQGNAVDVSSVFKV
jgi:hypothetical protein